MKLVFVYNAKSGVSNAIIDIAHKLISPKTYACSLCAVTHAVFSEDKQWKQYRENSKHDFEFLHKDEFEVSYGVHYDYPVILKIENNQLSVIKDKSSIDGIKSIENFIQFLEAI